MADARQQVTVLERGEGSPWLWHRIGRAYMCAIPGHFNGDPTDTLRVQVESDERLLDSALTGLPGFVHRDDLPPLAEIVRMDGTKEGDSYSYPVLASLAEIVRLGGDPLCGLGREGITRAVGSYYLADYVKEPPWYRRAIDEHPDRCADALVTVYRSRIRRRATRNYHLFALSDDAGYAEVARLAVPALLGVFPTRCTKPQVSALHALLWAGLLYVPKAELAERIRRRSAARGMDTAQRALWLAAGAVHFRQGIPPRGGGLRPDGAGTEGASYPEFSGARPARPPRPPRALGRLGDTGHRCTVQDPGPLVRPLVGQTRVALQGDDPQPEDRLASQALAGDSGGTSRGRRRGSTSIARQVSRPGLLVR